MDEELPPPLPSDFEHDLDHSRLHDEDEHESFGHIPLPEIDHCDIPDQNFIPPIIPKLENLNGMKSIPPKIREQTPTKLCSEYVENNTENYTLKESSNGAYIQEASCVNTEGNLSNGHNEGELDVREGGNNSTEVFNDETISMDTQKVSPPLSSATQHDDQLEVPNRVSPDPTADDNFDDEFGDFAVTTETDTKVLQQAAPVANTAKDEDDDWGEFDRAPRRDSHLTSNASFDGDDADFGAFGTSQQPVEETATVAVDSWTPEFKESPRADDENWEDDLLKEVGDIEWDSGNEEDACFDESDITELSFVLNGPKNGSSNSDCALRKSFELWCLLRIVEEAISLQYVFDGSTLATNHCRKINIDKGKVGKGRLTPISLDVLTPTPANVRASDTLEVLTPSPIMPDKEPSPTPSTSKIAFDSLSAPPAEFDWDKSGLTNPLKGTKGSSALLDVDFLSANTGASSSGAFALQKDLAAFGLDVAEPVERKISEKSILDTILSTTTPDTAYRPVSELSLDARALHDQLPDLSCLISTKVMLPFGGQ